MTQIIEVLVAQNGEVKIETRGFDGSSCKEQSRFLEQALGVSVTERLKPEFHQQIQHSLHNRQGEST